MLINHANYCEVKPKRILIDVKIQKDICLLSKKKLFPALTRQLLFGAVGNYIR